MASFATAFCVSYTRRFWPNAVIVRELGDRIELRRHNGQTGLAYREAPHALGIEKAWAPSPPFATTDDLRRLAARIDAYMRDEPDTGGADEWYASEVARMRERAPA